MPDATCQQIAKGLFSSLVFGADEITAKVFESIQFIDAGGDFGVVGCFNCNRDIPLEWWQKAVDRCYEKNFIDLKVILPCCNSIGWLNDLNYEFPVGFSRFAIEIKNPVYSEAEQDWLKEETFKELEKALGCSLDWIWAHY
ncbi:MAG TPA: hypothetical protein VF681_00070 [Abditibacteriaceae bacterium]